MIKINLISDNSRWKKYLKDPNRYIEKKIKNLNLKNNIYKKNTIFCTLLISGDHKIKKLNKKCRSPEMQRSKHERKIKQQTKKRKKTKTKKKQKNS